ncbi:MAG TPA: hypothetical protein VF097_03535 [Actinomycetota bacterium]
MRREAPCFLVEDLSEGRSELVYLQLTEDLHLVTDDDLRALKEYLRPLLLPGRPGRTYPSDMPHRVIE